VTQVDWFNLAAWIGWLSWAVLCAFVLRTALVSLLRRTLPFARPDARIVLAYAGMALVLVASASLHTAVFGGGQMYGGTFPERLSIAAYLVAPFGLPLLVGGGLVLVLDLLRCAFSAPRAGHP
jgi:hypothetical protein